MYHDWSIPTIVMRISVIGVLCVSTLASGGWLMAASKAEKRKAADELIKEALHREVYGMSAERQQLLDQAAQQFPDYDPVMWHRGFVRQRNQWIKAEDYAQTASDDPRLAAYVHKRGNTPNTVEGQLEIADWCRKRGLQEQEVAHLTQVLRLDSDHATTRRRLGFRRVDGVWMRDTEIEQTVQQLQRDQKALAAWRSKMEQILSGLNHRSELRRKGAEARLMEITDPESLVAMEQVLARDSERVALLVVEVVDRIPHQEAALLLARLAVYSPWPQIRETAARKLRERPTDTYVPTMLASMYTPVQSRMDVFRGPGGRLVYRHRFFRAGQNENQLLVLDTAYRRVALPDGDREESLARALNSAANRALEAETNVQQQNLRTAELNDRISWALSIATREAFPAKPESWWEWWNQFNEVYTEQEKQTRTVQQSQEVRVVDRSQSLDVALGGSQISPGQVSLPMDCLAAGTPIWTALGLVPVEKIQVGDLVLAQHVESGELAYKPVLRTTTRPLSMLVKFTAGGEAIETSGGHPFWVSGEGWVKGRDLTPGMELHSLSGTVPVSSTERSRQLETFNLVVADFNTYFVGQNKVLSHDNTVREPTNAIVPGLMAE